MSTVRGRLNFDLITKAILSTVSLPILSEIPAFVSKAIGDSRQFSSEGEYSSRTYQDEGEVVVCNCFNRKSCKESHCFKKMVEIARKAKFS